MAMVPARPPRPPRPFIRRAYLYKKDASGSGWSRRFFVLEQWNLRYFKDQDSTNAKGLIDLSKGRGIRPPHQCKVQWPPQANPQLCFGIATQYRTYYLYATDMPSIEQWVTELQRIIIERVGRVCPDWQNDIEGKPESEESKTMRGVVQIASMFAKGMADSGVLSDADSMAVKALASVAQGQAKAQAHTNWKERTKLGVIDGLKGLKKDDKGSVSTDSLILWQKPEADRNMQAAATQWNMAPGGMPQWHERPMLPAAPQWNTTPPTQWSAGMPAGTAGGMPNTHMPLGHTGNIPYALPVGSMYNQHQGTFGNVYPTWQQSAAPGQDLVPFYRYWKSSKYDHFYTTNIEEIGTAVPGTIGRFEYKSEGIQCLIFSRPTAGTVPLYHYWCGGQVIDHFYTTNPGEIGTTTKGQTGAYGYVSEGVAGYCYLTAMPGTVPLYRYYCPHAMDHLYTTNPQEIGATVPGETGNHGYKSEGIVGYVIPYSG